MIKPISSIDLEAGSTFYLMKKTLASFYQLCYSI